MNARPPAFQQFQMDFGRHLRDPHRAPRPVGVPARSMAAYNELVFNNMTGFLDSCFPVCRELLGEQRWRRLNRSFFRDWRSHTPWFREIPREFLHYLQSLPVRQPLPAWFRELAHYEWAELAVDVMDVERTELPPCADLLVARPVLNPAMLNLRYDWPVHRIGPDYRPRKRCEAHLLVLRDETDAVRFAEINPVTARLLQILAADRITGRAACLQVARELQHANPEAVVSHGRQLLEELRELGAIIGATS